MPIVPNTHTRKRAQIPVGLISVPEMPLVVQCDTPLPVTITSIIDPATFYITTCFVTEKGSIDSPLGEEDVEMNETALVQRQADLQQYWTHKQLMEKVQLTAYDLSRVTQPDIGTLLTRCIKTAVFI